MLKPILALLIGLASEIAWGCPPAHPLYCTILDLQPSATPAWAMQLSNSVARAAKASAVDPYLLLAIGMQESSLRDVNRVRGDQITDVGVFQLHVRTIANYGYDMERLLTDLDYQAQVAAALLAEKIKACAYEGTTAWACYHSATPLLKERYEGLVMRWYRGPDAT